MTVQHGSAYLQSFFVGDNLERFATDRFNEPRGLWFYAPIVVGGMMPWSVYLLALPWQSAVRVARKQRPLTDVEWRLLLWIAVPLLFFTISIGKQPRYILPVLPPLAILLARSMTTRIVESSRNRALAAATWGTAGLYAAIAVLLYRARPLFITTYPHLTLTGVAVIAASAAALFWIAATRKWKRLPAIASICAACLLLSVQFGALAGARPEPVEQMAALVAANRRANEPVGTYQALCAPVFYTRSEATLRRRESRQFPEIAGPVLLVTRGANSPAAVPLRCLCGPSSAPVSDAAGVRIRRCVPQSEQDFGHRAGYQSVGAVLTFLPPHVTVTLCIFAFVATMLAGPAAAAEPAQEYRDDWSPSSNRTRCVRSFASGEGRGTASSMRTRGGSAVTFTSTDPRAQALEICCGPSRYLARPTAGGTAPTLNTTES